MDAVKEYLVSAIIAMCAAGIIGMLAPENGSGKYLRYIVSICLLASLLVPLRPVFEMLSSLSGTTHEVFSGIALVRQDDARSEGECTTVHFGTMTDAEIEAYVASGEPMDKAGAYAIQGLSSLWIDGIEGCNYNVIGLPVRRLYKMLCDLGIDPISLRRGAGIG